MDDAMVELKVGSTAEKMVVEKVNDWVVLWAVELDVCLVGRKAGEMVAW